MNLNLDHIAPIHEEDEYGGFRVAIIARYESIYTPLKLDITSGDVITPEAVRYAFPSNFEDKMIDVWAYNIETVLAEKVETILRRSVLNTRPRDFYDVYILMKTQCQVINKDVFHLAMQATSEKRMSTAALHDKENIMQAIKEDETMRQRWERYCKENYYAKDIIFDAVIEATTDILR